MLQAIRNRREAAAGVIFLALGAAVLAMARSYTMGTATEMGPAYFPTLLAICLCVLGIIAIVQGARAHKAVAIGRWPLAPMVFVLVGVLSFAGLIDGSGLAIAVAAVVLFGCYERLLHRPLEVAVIAVGLVILADVIFIRGIQLPIDLW